MKPQIPPKTLLHLEWPRILERLSEHCSGAVATHLALNLDFAQSEAEIRQRLQLTTEARELIEGGGVPVLGEPPDIAPLLGAAARGSVLEAADLRAIGVHLDTAARLRNYFANLIDRSPGLVRLAENLADLPGLARQLLDAFDERGEISDSASGDLGYLRSKVNNLHDQLKERVDRMLKDEDLKGMLQDDYYTIREDRYVLPIIAGHKRHVPGIVHGWSGSGATVYIEPQPVVEANNKLLLAQAEVDREIRRILADLSRQVGEASIQIRHSVTALDQIDLAFAKGQLSKELDATAPILYDLNAKHRDPELKPLHLRSARHPLLCLGGVKVVPNDISLSLDQRVLVVTGPNTGGKTVALKTTGILCLMALAGLHIPAAPESVVPLVPGVYTDIGDEQSLDGAHSTFSGHIANIKTIFDALQPGSLVLLDELVVGTDPLQGAALAQAILESLADRDAFVLVTTHYEALKALPFEDNRFRNGAVGFDADKHMPTFKLSLDLPGASSALVTARRLGLDEWIVQRASELAGPEQRQLEQVIRRLESEAAQAENERRMLQSERHKLELARSEAEKLEAKLKERLRQGLARERSEALDEARKLRDEVKQMRRQLIEKSNDSAWLDRKQGQIEKGITQMLEGLEQTKRAEAGPQAEISQLQVGKRVFVVSLGTDAELVSLPDSKGRCQVRAGLITTRVELADIRVKGKPLGGVAPGPNAMMQARLQAGLRASAKEEQEDLRAQYSKKKKEEPKLPDKGIQVDAEGLHASKQWEKALPMAPDNTIDVRGLRADEAIDRVEAFLDQTASRERNAAYIIHGHGTNALKRELRSYLPKSPYVKEIRRGLPHEGGDGVTAVLLFE